ncbi:hypothetical protein Pelo_1255 [Pelomyxa schiedti]|nr:hypothetical protein Pelo_1255 [Pelomyxa schiedti]
MTPRSLSVIGATLMSDLMPTGMAWSDDDSVMYMSGFDMLANDYLYSLNLTGRAEWVLQWPTMDIQDIAWTSTGLCGYSGSGTLYKIPTTVGAPTAVGSTTPTALGDGDPRLGMSLEPTTGSLIASSVPVLVATLASVAGGSAGDALSFGRVPKSFSPECVARPHHNYALFLFFTICGHEGATSFASESTTVFPLAAPVMLYQSPGASLGLV